MPSTEPIPAPPSQAPRAARDPSPMPPAARRSWLARRPRDGRWRCGVHGPPLQAPIAPDSTWPPRSAPRGSATGRRGWAGLQTVAAPHHRRSHLNLPLASQPTGQRAPSAPRACSASFTKSDAIRVRATRPTQPDRSKAVFHETGVATASARDGADFEPVARADALLPSVTQKLAAQGIPQGRRSGFGHGTAQQPAGSTGE